MPPTQCTVGSMRSRTTLLSSTVFDVEGFEEGNAIKQGQRSAMLKIFFTVLRYHGMGRTVWIGCISWACLAGIGVVGWVIFCLAF